MESQFLKFPKMARLSREIQVTEKIDGTNAQIYINETGDEILAGSRNRWLSPENDNFGFAKWVRENQDELMQLGPGRHFGEWWGAGIQRRYGLDRKKFSLFNPSRWRDERPSCCDIVPVLYEGDFDTSKINDVVSNLAVNGSAAAPGFMNPEGVIIYHVAGRTGFKKTIQGDDLPKSLAG